MDVLSLAPSRPTLLAATDDPAPTRTVRARLAAFLAGLTRAPGEGPAGERATAITSRRAILLGFTAGEILLGVGLLVLATVTVPIWDGIASPALAGTALAGPTGGVLLWTMFGLLGSVRTLSSADGSRHFTFHLPFVGAAMILGGPTAGAWVAFLATTDRRELQSQPWYGVLANHASIAIAAIAGGVTYAMLETGLADLTGDPGLSAFVAVLVAGVMLEVVANGLTFVTIKIRDGMTWTGVFGIVVDDFRSETLLEIALIWILVIATGAVGWWAPLAIGLAVVAYLGTVRAPETDVLTGMLRKSAFLDKVDRKIGWMRLGLLPGGTMIMFDLNGFSRFNNTFDFSVGDEIIRIVASRMREVFPRQEDIVSRLMGDEFAVFLVGLTDEADALRKCAELVEAVERPIAASVGTQHVTTSVGVVVVTADGISTPSAAELFARAANSEMLAKPSPGEAPTSRSHRWRPGDPKAIHVRQTGG